MASVLSVGWEEQDEHNVGVVSMPLFWPRCLIQIAKVHQVASDHLGMAALGGAMWSECTRLWCKTYKKHSTPLD